MPQKKVGTSESMEIQAHDYSFYVKNHCQAGIVTTGKEFLITLFTRSLGGTISCASLYLQA